VTGRECSAGGQDLSRPGDVVNDAVADTKQNRLLMDKIS
jgi:hypothetical protein